MASAIIAHSALPGIIEQTRYIQFDHWMLNIPAINNPALAHLGLPTTIDISGKFAHYYALLMDAAGRNLAAIHTFAAMPFAPEALLAVGAKGSYLRTSALTPSFHEERRQMEDHKLISGEPIEVPNLGALRDTAEHIPAFMAAQDEHKIPYTVPAGTILDTMIQMLAEKSEDKTPHPNIACKMLMTSRSAAARIMRTITEYPIFADGCNSNSGAADVANMLGYNLRAAVTPDRAPLIDRSIRDEIDKRLHKIANAARYSTAAPLLTSP